MSRSAGGRRGARAVTLEDVGRLTARAVPGQGCVVVRGARPGCRGAQGRRTGVRGQMTTQADVEEHRRRRWRAWGGRRPVWANVGGLTRVTGATLAVRRRQRDWMLTFGDN
jgi:hypothetical protein